MIQILDKLQRSKLAVCSGRNSSNEWKITMRENGFWMRENATCREDAAKVRIVSYR
jgi:hypothetical protein